MTLFAHKIAQEARHAMNTHACTQTGTHTTRTHTYINIQNVPATHAGTLLLASSPPVSAPSPTASKSREGLLAHADIPSIAEGIREGAVFAA